MICNRLVLFLSCDTESLKVFCISLSFEHFTCEDILCTSSALMYGSVIASLQMNNCLLFSGPIWHDAKTTVQNHSLGFIYGQVVYTNCVVIDFIAIWVCFIWSCLWCKLLLHSLEQSMLLLNLLNIIKTFWHNFILWYPLLGIYCYAFSIFWYVFYIGCDYVLLLHLLNS